MQQVSGELLERFHRVLVEEIRSNRPEYLHSSFTVAEIYQHLVPYRTHRDRIGVEMNGDYEDALLRLLAGQGDYLVVESEHARRELREELESSNPNPSLFRQFAAIDVHLNPERLPDGEDAGGAARSDDPFAREVGGSPSAGEPAGDAGRRDSAVPVEDLAPAAESSWSREAEPAHAPDRSGAGEEAPSSAAGDAPASPPAHGQGASADARASREAAPDALAAVPEAPAAPREAPGAPPAAPAAAGGAAGAGASPSPAGDGDAGVGADEAAPEASSRAGLPCAWCAETLPDRENLNYCPFCGASVHLTPCSECGEELEEGWRFCLACGAPVEE